MAELDHLDLADGLRLAILDTGAGLSARPQRDDGGWRHAVVGDGAAAALVDLLAAVPDTQRRGRFTIRSWTDRRATGERAMGVDQTNESVIVGSAGVVKWATHLQPGPHPAPRRLAALRDAGFAGMPAPWGLVTWRPVDGPETLVAYIDEYLPGAVDGWTWAVDLVTAAAADPTNVSGSAYAAAVRDVGILVADLHVALARTATRASPADCRRWRDDALELLDIACTSGDSASTRLLRSRRRQVAEEFEALTGLTGAVVLEGHGDLHVGQVLRDGGGRFVVTDFDGNPVLAADQRMLPIPAAADVAGMAQSLAHAVIVAARYTRLDPRALAAVERTAGETFLQSYRHRLDTGGSSHLFAPEALRPLRIQQVLREVIYAATHLPRWMYVPDAALPRLFDDGTDR